MPDTISSRSSNMSELVAGRAMAKNPVLIPLNQAINTTDEISWLGTYERSTRPPPQ